MNLFVQDMLFNIMNANGIVNKISCQTKLYHGLFQVIAFCISFKHAMWFSNLKLYIDYLYMINMIFSYSTASAFIRYGYIYIYMFHIIFRKNFILRSKLESKATYFKQPLWTCPKGDLWNQVWLYTHVKVKHQSVNWYANLPAKVLKGAWPHADSGEISFILYNA
jgi:hypothetical protein